MNPSSAGPSSHFMQTQCLGHLTTIRFVLRNSCLEMLSNTVEINKRHLFTEVHRRPFYRGDPVVMSVKSEEPGVILAIATSHL